MPGVSERHTQSISVPFPLALRLATLVSFRKPSLCLDVSEFWGGPALNNIAWYLRLRAAVRLRDSNLSPVIGLPCDTYPPSPPHNSVSSSKAQYMLRRAISV